MNIKRYSPCVYSVKLFLGFLVNNELADNLNRINPNLLALFIQNEDNYLKEIIIQNKRYIGKSIEKAIDLPSLELLQLNIYSILKKMLPDYSFEKRLIFNLSLTKSACFSMGCL
jgi:hypothetical protein